MTNWNFKALLVLCLIALLSLSGWAQDCDCKDCKKKKEKQKIELDLEGLEEALKNIPDLSGLDEALDGLSELKELSALEEIPGLGEIPGLSGLAEIPFFNDGSLQKIIAEAAKFGVSIDLDAWKKEVSERIELTRKETKKAYKYLERLHEHWADDDLIICSYLDEDDEWFVDILHDVEDDFDDDTAASLTKWMIKKKKAVDKCLGRLGALGAEVGAGAGEWAEAYGEDWEAWGEIFGKRMEVWGESFGKDMEEWGKAFGRDMEDWGEDFGDDMVIWGKDLEKWGVNLGKNWAFGKDWEKWGENLAEDIEIQLNNTLDLNLDSLKQLSDLSVIIAEGGEDMEARIEEIVESAIGGIDWDQFGEDISIIVKKSIDDVPAIHLDNKEMLAGIEGIAEEVARAVEQVGKNLDKHEKGWKKKYSSDWNELIEALDEIGIELNGHAEDLEDMIIISDADEKAKLKKALKEKALLKKREAIEEREDELESLKDEIKRLKKEMQRMRKEQRKAREIDL